MSDKLMSNFRELTSSILDNKGVVERDLKHSATPDSAIATSAAKYRRALQMLADE